MGGTAGGFGCSECLQVCCGQLVLEWVESLRHNVQGPRAVSASALSGVPVWQDEVMGEPVNILHLPSDQCALSMFSFLLPWNWCQIEACCKTFAALLTCDHLKRERLGALASNLLHPEDTLVSYVQRCGKVDGVYCLLFGAFRRASPHDMLIEQDSSGFTPLITAAYYGADAATVSLLLSARADPNAQSKQGGTALSSACYVIESANSIRHIELLLDNRADPLICDLRGDNALHCAAYGGSKEAVDMILKAGVPINSENNGGWSAIRFAYQEGHTLLIAHLLKCGAMDCNAA